MKVKLAVFSVVAVIVAFFAATAQADNPLSSWKDGKTKDSIITFVEKVTKQGSPDFVPPEDRIATFDNDGTLWPSHPIYTQLAFALDRIKTLAPQHPEWKTKQPFKAVLDNDLKALAAAGEKGLAELMMVSHAGMSTAEFEAIVSDWFENSRGIRDSNATPSWPINRWSNSWRICGPTNLRRISCPAAAWSSCVR